MKKKELREYKNKSKADLDKDLRGLKEKLRVLKLDLTASKVKNIREIRFVKKSIAQILTIWGNK
mgnify:FL=1